jgi:hypothetical protein
MTWLMRTCFGRHLLYPSTACMTSHYCLPWIVVACDARSQLVPPARMCELHLVPGVHSEPGSWISYYCDDVCAALCSFRAVYHRSSLTNDNALQADTTMLAFFMLLWSSICGISFPVTNLDESVRAFPSKMRLCLLHGSRYVSLVYLVRLPRSWSLRSLPGTRKHV